MAKAEPKLTRAEKRELNKRNHALAKKGDAKGVGVSVRRVIEGEVVEPAAMPETPPAATAAPAPAVHSAIPPETFEPPAGAAEDDRPIDFDHEANKARRDLAKVLKAIGVTDSGIARQLDISPATLAHFYAEDLAHGAEAILAALGSRAVQIALSGNERMLTHVTKSLLAWGRDKGRPPFSAMVQIETAQAAMVGGTAAETRAAAGGTVRVTLKLSDNIRVKED